MVFFFIKKFGILFAIHNYKLKIWSNYENDKKPIDDKPFRHLPWNIRI